MVEILEGPKEWTRKVSCDHSDCKCVLRVKVGDVGKFGGVVGSPITYFVDCPTCGTMIVLKNLPPVATRAAKKVE